VNKKPYILTSLTLSGFRAYLDPKVFDFHKKRCLAIFAPNGLGKSSVIDALEFMFSSDGTLKRIGLRAIHNYAGLTALAHNLAAKNNIPPKVTICVGNGKDAACGDRPAIGANRPMPDLAKQINKCFAVDPIIRGHALRSFVETHTPEQRYADVASWLQLTPLVDVQKNLRLLRTQVKLEMENDSSRRRVDAQLLKHTSQAITTWNEAAILAYASALIAPLDAELSINGLTGDDSGYLEVKKRAEAEESNLGIAGLKLIRASAADVWEEVANPPDGAKAQSGAIPAFEASVSALSVAAARELEERSKAKQAAFQALWRAAEPLFQKADTAPADCPVCSTPIVETKAGDAASIKAHLTLRLAELSEYAEAKADFEAAQGAAASRRSELVAALTRLIRALDDPAAENLKTALAVYQGAIAAWPQVAAADSKAITPEIAKLLEKVDQTIGAIQAKQGEHTYPRVKAKIEGLLSLQSERQLAIRTQEELGKLSASLSVQASIISAEIRKRVEALLATIQSPMNAIYQQIQGNNAVPIRLELPSEDDTNQQRLNLLIDFAENRMGVQPSGYLSDSQIHSVALALRMAAIQQFNAAAPIIALDDIVTSYDADHRRTIAGLFATTFADFQIIITTHDERFFSYLKDQAAPSAWTVTRIVSFDPLHGPRFADHKVSDEMIEDRWASGFSAANEMRQAEEEWLLSICRDFGVSVRIRQLERAYDYERSELASGLYGFLKDIGLKPLPVVGVNNRFLDSLVKGVIENFGSHFQDAMYGSGSIGDEKARWEEFKAFRIQFACRSCGRLRFKRPISLKKPVCAHEGCEFPFAFPLSTAGATP
jgi:hypothetical protein